MNNLEILISDLLRDVNKFSVLNRVHGNYTLFTLDFENMLCPHVVEEASL